MQQRMAKMLRRAVDEISEMQAEARAEAEALIAAAEAEAEAARRTREEVLAKLAVPGSPPAHTKGVAGTVGLFVNPYPK